MRPGDRVAVCAPSGPVDPERLAEGVRTLEALGLQVHVPESAYEREFFTAGSTARRLEQLTTLFADPDIRGVFCARGGAGALQLLPEIDFARLAEAEKPFVGYSDVTPLHVGLNRHGRVTFHGPMVARDFAEAGLVDPASLMAGLFGEGQPLCATDLRTLSAGAGRGLLVGGCLALLAALAGTAWNRWPEGDLLLFIEDWNEPPYRLDRMLWQLRASGAFEQVRGVVLGELPGCEPASGSDYTLVDVLRRALEPLAVPVAMGLRSGHVSTRNLTVPLGVTAQLNCSSGGANLQVLEAAVE